MIVLGDSLLLFVTVIAPCALITQIFHSGQLDCNHLSCLTYHASSDDDSAGLILPHLPLSYFDRHQHKLAFKKPPALRLCVKAPLLHEKGGY